MHLIAISYKRAYIFFTRLKYEGLNCYVNWNLTADPGLPTSNNYQGKVDLMFMTLIYTKKLRLELLVHNLAA